MIEIVMPYHDSHVGNFSPFTFSADWKEQACIDAKVLPRKIIYFDPRPLTRECMTKWLATKIPEFQIFATSSAEEVIWLGQQHADLALILGNLDGGNVRGSDPSLQLETIRRYLPDVPLAVVTDTDRPVPAFKLPAGLRGLISTNMAGHAVLQVVRMICNGGTFVPAEQGGIDLTMLSQLPPHDDNSAGGMPLGIGGDVRRDDVVAHGPAAAMTQADPSWNRGMRGGDTPVVQKAPADGFTPRQSEILNCLRRGLSNKLIAYELQMCESTVKIHVRNIMKKLGATNRTQVVSMTWHWFETAAAGVRNM